MLTLNDGRNELWQWDTNRKLTVDAECSQIHFSNKFFGRSIDVDVVDGVASIPDILLQTDKELNAWVFVGTNENGYTKISKTFRVNRRNKPADYVFTPPEQTTLAEIMERLDDLEATQDPDAIKNAVDDYLANNPIKVNETDPTVPDWAKKPSPPDVKIPDKLPNPHTLTFTGAVNASYDGSSAVEIKIPDSGGNADQIILKSPDGTEWKITVSDSGVITATKVASGEDSGGSDEPETVPTTLETYTIFVPENVSDEWKVTGGNGELDMSTAEFLELFYDGFVSTNPSGVTVTKQSIGKDQSGQYDMWEYDFCPENYSRTILLSSGMHTYELSASFGLANFIGHLYTDTDNDAFAYIRNNVRVKVIPVVNPWGFNQYPKTYGNVNGVNPNRNFDLDGQWEEFEVYSADPTASNYNEWDVKGNAPFSEAEAHNLARWAEENWNAEFWIDCHTGEGYKDKDLWVYYSSDSVILDRINGGISAIEAWFKDTYGADCVTTRTIDSDGSIRLRWAEKVAGIPGMTLEQAPKRTTYGTEYTNEAADISNYSTNISTFVQEFLLEKYRQTESVAIQSVSLADAVIPYGTPSITVNAVVTPTTTTQNHFEWTSSDETVCKVYGGAEKAIVVRVGVGKATLTCKNRHNNSVTASCTVDVTAAEAFNITTDLTNVATNNSTQSIANGDSYTATLTIVGEYENMNVTVIMGGVDVTSDVYADGVINIPSVTGDVEIAAVAYNGDNFIFAGISGIDSTTGITTENNARVLTALIPADGGENIEIISPNGYYIKAFEYSRDGVGFLNASYIGGLTAATISGTLATACTHIRVLCKKSNNSAFTETEAASSTLKINGVGYSLIVGDITAEVPDMNMEVIDSTDCVCEVGTIGTDGTEQDSTARIRSDYIAVDGGQAAMGIAFDGLPDGCSFLCRFYNSNHASIEVTNYNPAWENGINTATGFLVCTPGWYRLYLVKNQNVLKFDYGSVAYARFILVAPNGADINTADFANAAIIVDGHEYKVKFA